MGYDEEFTSYAASRWGAAVRVVVLLGRPPGHAAALVTEALGRVRSTWDLGAERPDMDVALFAEVRRTVLADDLPWWTATTPEDRDLLETSGLLEIEPALDALDPVTRARLVLLAVTTLEPEQVDEVVPAPAARAAAVAVPAAEAVRFVGEGLQPAPYAATQVARVADDRRRHRRLARLLSAGAVVVLLAVVVPLAVREVRDAATLGEPGVSAPPTPASTPTPVRPPVVPERPLVPVAWAAEGRIHLGEREIRLDKVVGLGETGTGVVAVLADGRLVQPLLSQVASGLVSELGTVDPDAPVVADDQERVAWIDRGETTRLVVRDLVSGTDLLSVEVDPATRVVALRREGVWTTDDRGYAVTPVQTDRTRPSRFPGVALVTIVGGVRVVAPARDRLAVLVADEEPLDLDGDDAVLSDDGRYVAVHATDPSAARSWSVVDLTTDTSVPLALPDDARVQSVAFAADDRVVLAISRAEDRPYSIGNDQPVGQGPIYDIVTCDPTTTECRSDERLSQSSAAPVLAR